MKKHVFTIQTLSCEVFPLASSRDSCQRESSWSSGQLSLPDVMDMPRLRIPGKPTVYPWAKFSFLSTLMEGQLCDSNDSHLHSNRIKLVRFRASNWPKGSLSKTSQSTAMCGVYFKGEKMQSISLFQEFELSFSWQCLRLEIRTCSYNEQMLWILKRSILIEMEWIHKLKQEKDTCFWHCEKREEWEGDAEGVSRS